MPDLSASSSSTPPRLMTQCSCFLTVMNTSCFVDKTRMVKAVVDDPSENILLTAPRRFGKSVNLDMLLRFFNIEENNRSLFEKLKIGEHPNIIDDHCGKYSVLWIDFSWFDIPINSYENAVIAVRDITHNTYMRYKNILLTSDKLKDFREICSHWCDEILCEKLSSSQISRGISRLAMYLHMHFDKEVIILVDEFDFICRQAMSKVNQEQLNDIIYMYFQLFSFIVKTEKLERVPYIYKAIFTGITAVTCTGQSGLNNVPVRKFLEEEEYVDFYGILMEEFDRLLNKSEYSELRDQRNDALLFYNGYEAKNRKILCTYSVTSYLCRNACDPKLPLESYWCDSAGMEEFFNCWRKEKLQLLLKDLIKGDRFHVPKVEKFPASRLAAIHQGLMSASSSKVSETDINYFLIYLQQLGYLGIVSAEGATSILSIPNEEIRSEFKSIFIESFLSTYDCKYSILNECATQINRLIDITNEKSVKEAFTNFKNGLREACRACLVSEFLNEATLESLVFAILFQSKFTPLSQVRIIESLLDNRYSKKLDRCFYKNDVGIIIELKCKPGGTAKSAIDQIKTNHYDDIFKNGRIEGVDKTVYVGIHLDICRNNADKELTLAYTKNLAVPPISV